MLVGQPPKSQCGRLHFLPRLATALSPPPRNSGALCAFKENRCCPQVEWGWKSRPAVHRQPPCSAPTGAERRQGNWRGEKDHGLGPGKAICREGEGNRQRGLGSSQRRPAGRRNEQDKPRAAVLRVKGQELAPEQDQAVAKADLSRPLQDCGPIRVGRGKRDGEDSEQRSRGRFSAPRLPPKKNKIKEYCRAGTWTGNGQAQYEDRGARRPYKRRPRVWEARVPKK